MPHPVTRVIRTLAAALAVVAAAADVRAGLIVPAEPRALPELRFETMAGAPASIADFQGRVVVLNLWATWCAPCREEMPQLDRLQAAFDPAEAVVVALSVDRAGPERVKAFLDGIGVQRLDVYRDPTAGVTRALRIPGLPATLLIDRQGLERARVLGIATWDGPEAIASVRALLDEPPG